MTWTSNFQEVLLSAHPQKKYEGTPDTVKPLYTEHSRDLKECAKMEGVLIRECGIELLGKVLFGKITFLSYIMIILLP